MDFQLLRPVLHGLAAAPRQEDDLEPRFAGQQDPHAVVDGKDLHLGPVREEVEAAVGEDTVEGFIPISHLAIPKLEHSEDAFHIGEELPLKVIELDTDNRRLILSVKAFFFSRDPKLQEEYITLHEQYIRDRIARQQKKKAEKEARQREKTQEEIAKEDAEEAAMEQNEEQDTVLETVPEMETPV